MNQDTSASLSSELIDFYLVQSPYAHSDKPSSARSVDLQSLGWEKTNLDLLMRWITKELGDGGLEARLSFTIANKIPNELFTELHAQLDNCDKPIQGGCCTISRKIDADSSNKITCKLTETYATCFFRHIRNSIAHGNFSLNKTRDFVLFKDQASAIGSGGESATAALMISIKTLNELRDLITAGPSSIDEERLVDSPAYRVKRQINATLEPRHE